MSDPIHPFISALNFTPRVMNITTGMPLQNTYFRYSVHPFSQPGRSTLLPKELRCRLRADASSRFGGGLYSKMGGTDNMATLLEKHRPRIAVDADGGQYTCLCVITTSFLSVGRIICQGPQRPGMSSSTTTQTTPQYHSKGFSGSTSHLYELDRSSAQFPNQLDELLHSEQWTEDIEVLSKDEIKQSVGYLDEVRPVLALQAASHSEFSDPRQFGFH